MARPRRAGAPLGLRGAAATVIVAGLLLAGSACGAAPVDGTAAPTVRPSRATSPDPVKAVRRPSASPPRPTSARTASSTPTAVGASSSPTRDGGTASVVLGVLPVKGRASMTGYDRDEFGQAWLDADRNGCDTRNDMLRAHLTDVRIEPGTYGCKVTSGVLADPYTSMRIVFVEGDGTLVDIDHVVALGDAWATGAATWPIRKRAAFANDPLNLLPVDASANRQKGDGDAATWLPSNKAFRCSYVSRQLAVKQKYGLWLTPAEKAAVGRVLASCPGWPLPPDVTHAPVMVSFAVAEPSASSAPSADVPSGSVYYANCDAARAAGAAPVYRGDPGYGPHLDRDGDGVACE